MSVLVGYQTCQFLTDCTARERRETIRDAIVTSAEGTLPSSNPAFVKTQEVFFAQKNVFYVSALDVFLLTGSWKRLV